jgi:DNA-binding NarL/FixJ family response regulator
MRKVRVVLADEHDFLRTCIRGMLETQLSLSVVGEVRILDQAEAILGRIAADMVLMHCPLPGVGVVKTAQRIRRRHPGLMVFLLTHYQRTRSLEPFLREHTHGLFGCGSSVQDLWKRIEQFSWRATPNSAPGSRPSVPSTPYRPGAAADENPSFKTGGATLQMRRPTLSERHGSKPRRKVTLLPDGRDPATMIADLTAREKEVLALIADTFLNRQIAEHLNISVRTVENHRASIKRKTGLSNTAGLVRLAVAAQLTPSKNP